MTALNEFVTLLAGFIGEPPTSTRVAWVVVAVVTLFVLWLLRWLINWYFKTNEIVTNQKHILAILETHSSMAINGRQLNAIPVPAQPNMVPPTQIRQHPIDDEFSEILNVRPHNLRGGQTQMRPQPVPRSVTNNVPAQPVRMTPNLPPPPSSPPASVPIQAPAANFSPPQSPVISGPGNPLAAKASAQANEAKETLPSPEIKAKPANTSVTMLGSPEQRAERQMEAREAMRLAEQAANATRSKTADIPDIPTALIRTYSGGKTNPLTGKRVGDNAGSDSERKNNVPSQFQLRD